MAASLWQLARNKFQNLFVSDYLMLQRLNILAFQHINLKYTYYITIANLLGS